MKLLRWFLMMAVLLFGYSLGVMVYLYPRAGIGLAFVAAVAAGRKGVQYTSFGTSRWATSDELAHMTEG